MYHYGFILHDQQPWKNIWETLSSLMLFHVDNEFNVLLVFEFP